jgi:ZIP family zinc transporter
MLPALGWGALAASSLIVGALLALARTWSDRAIGAVLAFGAGALISAVSFELAEEGIAIGGAASVGIGLAAGALAYFFADRAVERRFTGAGWGLALGALLDGIPEQAVLGIGIASGAGVSVALLLAVFVSNVPEAMGSANDMRSSGRSRAFILRMWTGVAVLCALCTGLGWLLADATGGHFKAGINGFAAGALLVMLTDSMIPEVRSKGGLPSGLIVALGFAVAAGLSSL